MAQSFFPRRILPWTNKKNKGESISGDIVDANDVNQIAAEIQSVEEKVLEHVDLLISNRQDRNRLEGRIDSTVAEVGDRISSIDTEIGETNIRVQQNAEGVLQNGTDLETYKEDMEDEIVLLRERIDMLEEVYTTTL